MAATAGALIAAAAGLLLFSPIGERALNSSASLESRMESMSTTAQAALDFLPFGSGLGTFQGVPLYENPDLVDAVGMNHAHNDYLSSFWNSGCLGP